MARRRGGRKADITVIERKFVTPRGIASWAYLTEPVENMNGREQFKITLFFDPNDKEFKAFVKKLMAAEKQHAKETGLAAGDVGCIKFTTESDLKKRDDKDRPVFPKGVEVGQPYIQFDSVARENKTTGQVDPIPVVDANARPTDVEVWRGDIVRVQTSIVGWELNGDRGVKCYLNGVQHLKTDRADFSGTDAFTADEVFAEEDDGGFAPEGDSADAEKLAAILGDDDE